VAGENNSSESGVIMYDCVEFEDYLGNVGLIKTIILFMFSYILYDKTLNIYNKINYL